jgi:serine/threonine protein kinase
MHPDILSRVRAGEGRASLDASSDMWALGLILYEALTLKLLPLCQASHNELWPWKNSMIPAVLCPSC